MPIRAAPYAHQQRAFAFSYRLFTENTSSGVALLMEMGTGKTITSIAIAGALALSEQITRVLIVAPLSILGVWQEEFSRFAGFDYNLTVLTGTDARKAATLRNLRNPGLQMAVVNYESAWRLEQEIAMWQPDLIICDEGHKIKSHRTNASKAMHRLSAKAHYRLLLTGTPVTNKVADIFSQYKFLHPGVFGTSFYAFRNRYFEQGYFPSQLTMREHMEPDFTQRLHSIAFRATKAQCLDLPDTVDIIRPVELEPAARRSYRDLVRDSFAELSAEDTVTASNILARLMRLSQLTGGFIKADDGGLQCISRAKLAALEDIIEQAVAEGKKLVVIARFVPEIKAICRLLEKMGVGHSCVMGGVKDRDEQVARFQNDPEVQVFVGQIQTAGLGITLTAASTMVFYSTDYSMSNHEQRVVAKNVNFGVYYGLYPRGLQRTLKLKAGQNVPLEQCERIIANLKAGYPALARWQEETKTQAERRQYVETFLGRRRYLPGITSTDWGKKSFAQRCALNTPIQGTAADMLKLALGNILAGLPDCPWLRPLLQVHDELVFEIPATRVEEAVKFVKHCMEMLPFPEFYVPVIAEAAVGSRLGRLEEVDCSA